ncbi:GntR family transcriptional regulator [Rugosimonospora africana]|uniref:GntR family transcriptional regulator n=1 Tax=Rugosimonospora africana TaxID=556532 RepID=A0A8J3VU22_9ACTN|nr:GntR family transcriptional regulator [Rugosimonospora africana]GIH18609.1 GntR family transcriptional regulator [Rugosimonospora africana]
MSSRQAFIPHPASAGPGQGLSPVVRGRAVTRTSDRVYDELVSAIRELRLVPGASLSETDLAERLHVSRTPVREALARLADAGLVHVVPQVGTRVGLIGLRDVEEARFVRESLEISAFEVACEGSAPDVSTLRELLERQEHSYRTEDYNAFFAADEALHGEIFNLSGYPGAWQAVQRTKLQLDRLRRLVLPDLAAVRVLIDEHRSIVDALEATDIAAGRTLISRHARRAIELAPSLRARYPDYFTD